MLVGDPAAKRQLPFGSGDLVMCLGDFNGHVGRHIDGVLEEYGVGQSNLEGRMVLEFCLVKELCVSNTWFMRWLKRRLLNKKLPKCDV